MRQKSHYAMLALSKLGLHLNRHRYDKQQKKRIYYQERVQDGRASVCYPKRDTTLALVYPEQGYYRQPFAVDRDALKELAAVNWGGVSP